MFREGYVLVLFAGFQNEIVVIFFHPASQPPELRKPRIFVEEASGAVQGPRYQCLYAR